MLERIRPHPHRGDLIAAGAVPLTVAVVMINVRFEEEWGKGILLVLTLLACALLLGMGLLARREGEYPRAYQTVLLLAGLTLLALSLVRLAEVFGAAEPLSSAGALTWIAAVFAAVAAIPAWERINSPVCALVEVVAGGIVLLAFVEWVFDPDGNTTFRWLLVLLIVLYAVAHLRWRQERPRHAVHMVNAAGLATLGIAGTFVGGFIGFPGGDGADPGTWWELVLVAAGGGLIAYAAADREPGPAYLGFLTLLAFVFLAGPAGDDGASLIGWPLLLALLGGAAVAAGLRPLRPLPPEPGPAETAPTTPLPTAERPPEERPTEPLPPSEG